MYDAQIADLSPLGLAITLSPQMQERLAATENLAVNGTHPFIDAIAAFLSSPAGQALETAIINALLALIK
jgi:hypothetical protein